MSNISTVVTFGLRHKGSRELVRVYADENGSHSCSGEYRYQLYLSGDFPQFEVDTAEKAALVLVINTPWYNSTAELPSWSSVKVAELEVVEIFRTTEITRAAIETPVVFGNTVDYIHEPRASAELYLGRALPADEAHAILQMQVVRIPEGESIESLQRKCHNRAVIIGEGSQYPEFSFGVFELPAEHSSMLLGQPGVGILTRSYRR